MLLKMVRLFILGFCLYLTSQAWIAPSFAQVAEEVVMREREPSSRKKPITLRSEKRRLFTDEMLKATIEGELRPGWRKLVFSVTPPSNLVRRCVYSKFEDAADVEFEFLRAPVEFPDYRASNIWIALEKDDPDFNGLVFLERPCQLIGDIFVLGKAHNSGSPLQIRIEGTDEPFHQVKSRKHFKTHETAVSVWVDESEGNLIVSSVFRALYQANVNWKPDIEEDEACAPILKLHTRLIEKGSISSKRDQIRPYIKTCFPKNAKARFQSATVQVRAAYFGNDRLEFEQSSSYAEYQSTLAKYKEQFRSGGRLARLHGVGAGFDILHDINAPDLPEEVPLLEFLDD